MNSTRPYFKEIDALRFMAFALIFLSHVFVSNDEHVLHAGWYTRASAGASAGLTALEFFFVLSGFLITRLIFEEQGSGGFDFKKYFARRSLRIWPLYFFTVALGYAVALSGHASHQLPPWYHFVFFTLNFYVAQHGTAFLFFLVFLWTIAVEEQFYIFWGLAMKWGRKYFTELCAGMILLSLFFRMMNFRSEYEMLANTFGVCGDFAVGALIARMSFYRTQFFERSQNTSRGVIVLFYALLLSCLVFYRMIFMSYGMVVFERLIFSLLFGFVIFEQVFAKNSFFKSGNSRVLTYLGKISYGLYIFHGIVIAFFSKLAAQYHLDGSMLGVLIVNPLIILVLTILFSVLSYELAEKRILKLKQKFY
ncbi:MAG TPA: acyltransferase [Bacteroidia bacterium]